MRVACARARGVCAWCVRVRACVCAFVYVRSFVRSCVCAGVRACMVRPYIRACLRACVCTYIGDCMYKCMHACMHVRSYIHAQARPTSIGDSVCIAVLDMTPANMFYHFPCDTIHSYHVVVIFYLCDFYWLFSNACI